MVTNQYQKLVKLVNDSQEDFDKFYNKQISAAGTRVRGVMQNLKQLAQEIRLEVQNMKNEASKNAQKK